MNKHLGSIIFEDDKIILKYNEGYKEIFNKSKIDYSEGAQWIDWKGERYFLKRD
jgi:hypothetical protein